MENPIIWDKCILCQDDSTELFQCPAESLPLNKILNEANDIEHCLITNKARWHKSCNSKFNTTELKRVQKRLSNSSLEDVCAKKYTRKNVQSSSHSLILSRLLNVQSSSHSHVSFAANRSKNLRGNYIACQLWIWTTVFDKLLQIYKKKLN